MSNIDHVKGRETTESFLFQRKILFTLYYLVPCYGKFLAFNRFRYIFIIQQSEAQLPIPKLCFSVPLSNEC